MREPGHAPNLAGPIGYDDRMPSRIAQSIERQLGMAGLVDALAGKLSASDLRSLLMEVYAVRSAAVTEAEIRGQSGRDPLMAPSAVSARDLMAFDAAAFQAASEFTALDLSPAGPFAAASRLGGTSQNNVLTAIRNAEALGDPIYRAGPGSLSPAAFRRRGPVVRQPPGDSPAAVRRARILAALPAVCSRHGRPRYRLVPLRDDASPRARARVSADLPHAGLGGVRIPESPG